MAEPEVLAAGAAERAPTAAGARSNLWMIVFGLATLTAVLGFYRVNRRGIGHDEAVSHSLATGTWDYLWDTISERELNMVLHTLLLRGWRVLGDSLVLLRGLSVLATVATVVVTFAVGRRLISTRAGVVAALVLAFHPLLIHHAQNARAYALATFLAVLATERLAAAVASPSPLRWIAYAVVGALLVYAHLLGLFVLAGHGVAMVLVGHRIVGWRAPALAAGGIGVLLLPVWLFLLSADRDQLSWIGELGLEDYERFAVVLGANWRILSIGFIAAGLAVAAAAVVSGRAGATTRSWTLTLVLCTGAVPVAGPVAVSLVEPILVPPYLVLALPGMALTVAAAIDMIRRTSAVVLIVGVVLVLSAVSLGREYRRADPEPWRDLADFVMANARPGDGLVVHPGSGRLAFEYHAVDSGPLGESLQPALPSEPWGELRVDDAPFSRSVDETAFRAAVAQFTRVWMILDDADNALREEWAMVRSTMDRALRERCGSADEQHRGRFRVLLFDCATS